jgi:hypothetical protein
MTTTYVFGAGASRHAGYPLASEMGEGLLRAMGNSVDARSRASAEDLIKRFGKPSNIEDLITEIQVAQDALKSATAEKDKAEYARFRHMFEPPQYVS